MSSEVEDHLPLISAFCQVILRAGAWSGHIQPERKKDFSWTDYLWFMETISISLKCQKNINPGPVSNSDFVSGSETGVHTILLSCNKNSLVHKQRISPHPLKTCPKQFLNISPTYKPSHHASLQKSPQGSCSVHRAWISRNYPKWLEIIIENFLTKS